MAVFSFPSGFVVLIDKHKNFYREMNMRAEEDRCSRLREELLTLREDMNKAYLSRDMLEQQKMESDGLIAQIEKSKGT